MKRVHSLARDESGAITVMTIIIMIAILGIMALVVDLGHLHIVQNELQNAADTCALRGARAFIPDQITGVTPLNPDPDRARSQASATINKNRSDDQPLTKLPISDIQVGIWNCETRNWVGGAPSFSWPPDSSLWGLPIGPAVGLPTQKAPDYNAGPVSMTLANIFGISTVPVRTRAIAYLSPFGGPMQGITPILPFGPWATNKLNEGQLFTGTFRNDNSDTVGWSNLQGVPQGEDPNRTSANDLKNIVQGKMVADAGGEKAVVSLNNGQISSAIMEMTKTGNRFGLMPTGTNNVYQTTTADNPAAPPTTPPTTYATTEYLMPVFDKSLVGGDPTRFNQAAVVGGVMVNIIEVGTPPLDYIIVKIIPGTYVAPGYGGGKVYYGVLSTVPKLVQ